MLPCNVSKPKCFHDRNFPTWKKILLNRTQNNTQSISQFPYRQQPHPSQVLPVTCLDGGPEEEAGGRQASVGETAGSQGETVPDLLPGQLNASQHSSSRPLVLALHSSSCLLIFKLLKVEIYFFFPYLFFFIRCTCIIKFVWIMWLRLWCNRQE